MSMVADWSPATAGPPLGSGVSQAAGGGARRMREQKISLDRSRSREIGIRLKWGSGSDGKESYTNNIALKMLESAR